MNSKTHEQSQSKTVCGFSQKKWAEAMRAEESGTFSSLLTKQQRRVRGERKKRHSPAQIAEEFRFDGHGHLFFKILRPGRSVHKPAGYLRPDGYVAVRLQGQIYLAHRVIWCLATGKWPSELLDHINGNKTDNRVENLREVTVKTNHLNRTRARNASGCVGVTWAAKEQNWRASITVGGKGINLGHFNSLEQAIKCRKQAEKTYGYLQL